MIRGAERNIRLLYPQIQRAFLAQSFLLFLLGTLVALFFSNPLYASLHRWYDNYQTGLQLIEEQDYEKAIIYIKQALLEHDTLKNTIVFDLEYVEYFPYFFIAECHYRISQSMHAGEYLQRNELYAVQYYKECIERNAHREKIRARCEEKLADIANDLSQRKQFYDAASIFRYLNNTFSGKYEDSVALLDARSFFKQGDFSKVIKNYEKAEELGIIALVTDDPAMVEYWSDYYQLLLAYWNEFPKHPYYKEKIEKLAKQLLPIYLYSLKDLRKADSISRIITEIQQDAGKLSDAEMMKRLTSQMCICECMNKNIDTIKSEIIQVVMQDENVDIARIEEKILTLLECDLRRSDLYYLRALLFLSQGQHESALKDLEAAMNKGTLETTAYELASCLYLNEQNFGMAKKAMLALTEQTSGTPSSIIMIIEELAQALELWKNETKNWSDVFQFTYLSPQLLQVLSSSSSAGKFFITIKEDLTVDIIFKADSLEYYLFDGFQLSGTNLNFDAAAFYNKILQVRLASPRAFKVLSVNVENTLKCFVAEAASDKTKQNWIVSVEMDLNECQNIDNTGILHIKTNLANHESIDLMVHLKKAETLDILEQ